MFNTILWQIRILRKRQVFTQRVTFYRSYSAIVRLMSTHPFMGAFSANAVASPTDKFKFIITSGVGANHLEIKVDIESITQLAY